MMNFAALVSMFNPTVDLGDVISVLTILAAGITSYGRLRVMDYRIRLMWNDYKSRYGIEDENGG